MAENETVGIAGLGRMGCALAVELTAEGLPLVVYNGTARDTDELANEIGPNANAKSRELAAWCSLGLVLVADGSGT